MNAANGINEVLELVRLEELAQYNILNTPEDPFYDDIVHLISQVCGTSMAFISFMDEQAFWLKAKKGLDAEAITRQSAFCSHTVQQNDVMVVPDLMKDARFNASPFVTQYPCLRFYAGIPLVNENGFVLGTLCVLDVVSRNLTKDQVESMRAIQRVLVRELETRRQSEERWRFMDNMLKTA